MELVAMACVAAWRDGWDRGFGMEGWMGLWLL